jgi:hypothetical protein
MALDKTIKQYSNFSKGLMTESTPLNFPDNYSLDEQNMLLRVDGSRERRLGMKYENNNQLNVTTTTTDAVGMAFYKWAFADDKVANVIGVVQVGQQLFFLDMETDNPSANLLNGGSAVSITSYMKTSSAHPTLSFSDLNGFLLITSSDFNEPIKVKYATATDAITISTVSILVRDMWGVDDGLDNDEKPGSLSVLHEYNLLNQGWTSANITTYGTPYPSNGMIMYFGKDSTGAWTPATLNENFFGNSLAPKGKFVINFFDRGTGAAGIDTTNNREALSGVAAGLPDDIETGMFSQVATNFGRVFWAGSESDITDGDDKSPNAGGLILFSQIVEREEQIGWCHTEADLTSEVINNQVDSDGGFMQIPELGKVIKMVALNNQLVIFATNGVWTVVAGENGFTPTNYQINKITDIGVAGPDSIVNVEGTVVYWSESGIYQMTLNEISQQAVVKDVTLQTIKTLYNAIPTEAKDNVKGYYDSINKQIGWIYQSDANWDFTNLPDFCDKELIYDLQLQAFTVNKISSKTVQSPYVVGAIIGQNTTNANVTEDIEVNGDQVQVNGVDVQVTTEQSVTTNTKLIYLTYVPVSGVANFTLSSYSNTGYLDWETEDYESFIETGYVSFEDFARTKTVPYLMAHFERTEDGFDVSLNPTNPSSCFVRAKWEWTDNSASNKWGSEFQAYRYRRPYVPADANDLFETGHLIITTRNKIRGSGKAVRFRFRSENGKNFKLYGFAITATGNTSV